MKGPPPKHLSNGSQMLLESETLPGQLSPGADDSTTFHETPQHLAPSLVSSPLSEHLQSHASTAPGHFPFEHEYEGHRAAMSEQQYPKAGHMSPRRPAWRHLGWLMGMHVRKQALTAVAKHTWHNLFLAHLVMTQHIRHEMRRASLYSLCRIHSAHEARRLEEAGAAHSEHVAGPAQLRLRLQCGSGLLEDASVYWHPHYGWVEREPDDFKMVHPARWAKLRVRFCMGSALLSSSDRLQRWIENRRQPLEYLEAHHSFVSPYSSYSVSLYLLMIDLMVRANMKSENMKGARKSIVKLRKREDECLLTGAGCRNGHFLPAAVHTTHHLIRRGWNTSDIPSHMDQSTCGRPPRSMLGIRAAAKHAALGCLRAGKG